jgi:hypothetical protein
MKFFIIDVFFNRKNLLAQKIVFDMIGCIKNKLSKVLISNKKWILKKKKKHGGKLNTAKNS